MSKVRYGGMRRFRLDRHVDVTGVSGTGCVAQGVVFGDGTTVVRWLGDSATTTVHDSVESVERIHLHEGRTTIRWEDPICFQCGATLGPYRVDHCFDCGAGQGKTPHLETRPDPSLVKWSLALRIEDPPEAKP